MISQDLQGLSTPAISMAFDAGEEALVVGCRGGQVKLWDLEYGKGRMSRDHPLLDLVGSLSSRHL